MTAAEVRDAFSAGEPVVVAIIGDSTTSGFGANPGPNVWTNGISYGCTNQPAHGPNWDASSPYYLNANGIPTQAQQDNRGIPSATRLLRTYLQSINPASEVYNYGGSGWVAATHVSSNTMASVAARSPRPQVVFFALGINSAKNNQGQAPALRALVAQALGYGMIPVLVKEHNVGVAYTPSGSWSNTATPDTWVPMDNWPSIRAEVDQVAAEYGVEVLDLGDTSGSLDITKLYDSFHPNEIGYRAIFEKYRAWFGALPIALHGGALRQQVISSGAIRVSTSSGIVALPVSRDVALPVRVATSAGIFGII